MAVQLPIISWHAEWSKDLADRMTGNSSTYEEITTSKPFVLGITTVRNNTQGWISGNNLLVPEIQNLYDGFALQKVFYKKPEDLKAIPSLLFRDPTEFYNELINKTGMQQVKFSDISYYILITEIGFTEGTTYCFADNTTSIAIVFNYKN